MQYTDDQLKTIDIFIEFLAVPDQKFMVIQGAAGSGKSTLIKYMAKMAEKHKAMSALLMGKHKSDVGFNLVLAATTNPASAVLQNFTQTPAGTIHSHLGLVVRNDFTTGKKFLQLKKNAEPITDSLIIIDEASMIDSALFEMIDKQTINCKIVMIGDQYQLAPVSQTETVMETLTCPKATMNKIMRNSGIIMKTGSQYRSSVENGLFIPMPTGHQELCMVNGATFKEKMEAAYMNDYDAKAVKVIAWTNKRVQAYSDHIRTAKGYPKRFQTGEQVITNKPILIKGHHISVDSNVTITRMGQTSVTTMGVIGRMVEIDGCTTSFLPDSSEAERVLLKNLSKKKNWTDYFDVKDNWLDLRLPYACTVHKSQGNTYDTVFIDLSDIGKCKIPSDVARLLYVAISRARKQVYLYGKLPVKYGG